MATIECYQVDEVEDGVFVYALMRSVAEHTGEPAHWACPRCYGNGKVGILQCKHDGAWYCSLCDRECVSDETDVEPTLV